MININHQMYNFIIFYRCITIHIALSVINLVSQIKQLSLHTRADSLLMMTILWVLFSDPLQAMSPFLMSFFCSDLTTSFSGIVCNSLPAKKELCQKIKGVEEKHQRLTIYTHFAQLYICCAKVQPWIAIRTHLFQASYEGV